MAYGSGSPAHWLPEGPRPGGPFTGPHNPTRFRVLIVGADEPLVEALAALTRRWGHEPVLAVGITAGLLLAWAQAPRLVLLDARLGREAFALARRLLRLPAGPPHLMLVAGPRLVDRPPGRLENTDFAFYRLSPFAPTSSPSGEPAVG